jgi:hypothetical protein
VNEKYIITSSSNYIKADQNHLLNVFSFAEHLVKNQKPLTAARTMTLDDEQDGVKMIGGDIGVFSKLGISLFSGEKKVFAYNRTLCSQTLHNYSLFIEKLF